MPEPVVIIHGTPQGTTFDVKKPVVRIFHELCTLRTSFVYLMPRKDGSEELVKMVGIAYNPFLHFRCTRYKGEGLLAVADRRASYSCMIVITKKSRQHRPTYSFMKASCSHISHLHSRKLDAPSAQKYSVCSLTHHSRCTKFSAVRAPILIPALPVPLPPPPFSLSELSLAACLASFLHQRTSTSMKRVFAITKVSQLNI